MVAAARVKSPTFDEPPHIGAGVPSVLDPNLVAHGSLMTTDVRLPLFTVLFAFALWR